MGNPVVHFEVATSGDAKALQDFYAKAFDWNIDANNPMNYGMVDTGGDGALRGGVGPAPEGSSGHVTFYVAVPDLQAALDKIEELGGKTIQPPMEVPNVVTLAIFADPAGNMIGLVKDTPPGG